MDEPFLNAESGNGFLPLVTIHRRGGKYYQESAYSLFVFTGIMFLSAVIFLAVLEYYRLKIDFKVK